MAKAKSAKSTDTSANLGFEAKLWLAADKLRNKLDAAEYIHVVLGLIFLKYISEPFDEHHAKLVAGKGEYDGAYPAVRPEIIGAIEVAISSDAKIHDAFHRACSPLCEQAEANRNQSRTLATLRDTLLPQLLSGELRVTEALTAA